MNSNPKKLVTTALMIAMCVIIPMLFHGVPQAGPTFLPMHLPVFLTGFICGPVYGLLCGIAGPALSAALTGMPAGPMIPSMMLELAVYGIVTGLMYRSLPMKNHMAKTYTTLILAMLIGRITYGIANTYLIQAGSYNMNVWLGFAFVTALPGIVIQLIFIPLIVDILERNNFIYD